VSWLGRTTSQKSAFINPIYSKRADVWEVLTPEKLFSCQLNAQFAQWNENFSKLSSPCNLPYTMMMELTFEKLSSKVSTQLLKRQLTAHTTSQKSAHHAIHPIHSWWSWLLRSRSQKSSHCTHRKLRTTSQQSAHYTICTATWEHLKSRLAIVTHMWNYA